MVQWFCLAVETDCSEYKPSYCAYSDDTHDLDYDKRYFCFQDRPSGGIGFVECRHLKDAPPVLLGELLAREWAQRPNTLRREPEAP